VSVGQKARVDMADASWRRVADLRLQTAALVPETGIHSNVARGAPFVLSEKRILLDVRMRRRSCCPRARERLNEANGLILIEGGELEKV